MNTEELSEYVLRCVEQTAAVADVVAIICSELSRQDQPTASRIASVLNQLADNPNVATTPSFERMAPWFAEHLRGNIDQPFLSLQARPASESGLETLQSLMKKMKK